MSEAQIDQSITHAELRVPPPNEAEAAAFAKYHGKSYLEKRSMNHIVRDRHVQNRRFCTAMNTT